MKKLFIIMSLVLSMCSQAYASMPAHHVMLETEIMFDIGIRTIDSKIDTDGDGTPDYYRSKCKINNLIKLDMKEHDQEKVSQEIGGLDGDTLLFINALVNVGSILAYIAINLKI